MKKRLRILWINVVNSYFTETAYFGQSWANFLSTLTFTLTYILFIRVIFSNISSVAGYSQNDMMFFIFMGQLQFYILTSWSTENLSDMVSDVNQGAFDMVLARPLPALFYTTTKNINIVSTLRDAVPPLAIVSLLIHWNQLALTPVSILAAITAFIAGQCAMHVVQFMLAVPVFWWGEATSLFAITYSIERGRDVPLEGMTRPWRIAVTMLVPVFISTAVASSLALQKSPIYPTLLMYVGIAVIALLVRQYVWKLALRAYSSASS